MALSTLADFEGDFSNDFWPYKLDGCVEECQVELLARIDSLEFDRMPNQLIPPPELAPPSVKHLPLEKRIELWGRLVDDCEAFLRAGLRKRVGAHGDWQEAYRQWYARHMDEHERAQIQFLEDLSRREAACGN